VLLQFAFFLGIGLLLWAFYREHPPAAPFAKGDAVFADYLVHHMPSGVRGLVLGAVFAAAMSTLSSSLNSSATALVNDVVQPLRGRSTDDPRLFGLARGATAGFGAAQIAVALGWPSDSSVIGDVLAIASFTTGILLGVFFLARLRTAVSPTAAVAALLGGAVATTSVLLLPQFDGPRIAWPWFTPIGAVAAFATGVLVNALLRQRRGTSPR
jgi:Na+/proline symporter